MSNFKKALITGACGGIGSQLARELSGDYRLILIDRDAEKLDSLRLELGGGTQIIACDLGDEESYVEPVKEVLSEGLDLLINNAAFVGTTTIEGWAVDFANQSLDAWRSALEVNLLAPFRLAQLCADSLCKSDDGNIVNISSIYGMGGQVPSLYEGTEMANPAAYGASKAGLLQLTQWLATTLAPNVRVNAVSPGGIERGQPGDFQKRYEERTPMGRMGSEQDIVGAVKFLASKSAGYVTGQNIAVDGGWSAW